MEAATTVKGYRVQRVLFARPGVHTVMEAVAPDESRVAITLLDPELADDQQLRSRVLELAEIRASLNHPNLIPILEVFTEDGRVALVSHLAGSGTLADRLRSGPLEPDEAVSVLAQVAGALEAAAGQGLVYRDLAPESIVLGDEGVMLGDFGITVPPLRGGEVAGVAEGIDYFSPEEVRGEPLKPESNVYSLGCILFECLTGASPFPYDRPLLTMHAHVVEPPPRVSVRRPGLPAALDEVVIQAMAKEPAKRFGSAGLLMRAAGEALAPDRSAPVPARPPDHARARPRARSGPRPRHGSRRIALALPAVALCGLVIGLIDWSPAPAREAADRAPTAGERVQRLEHQRAVNDAVNDLAARRTAIRHRLRRAVRPAGQAAAANALADAYGVARETLDGSGAALRRDSPIRTSLRDAERSYQRLARAAQRRDRRQWRDARRQTRRHEAYLERALG